MAVAAYRHGAPAAAVRAGIIIKEETAGGIGTPADRGVRTFDEEFGGGPGKCGEKPVQAAFARDKLQSPRAFVRDQFIVPFRDAQNLVDGHDPGGRKRLFVYN